MKPTAEDMKKIAAYRAILGKYEKPSVTADIVAVRPAFGELRDDQWRENPKFALEILLIKRGLWPYEGFWALPGGFIQGKNKETVEEGAARELKEEAGLKARDLIPVGVFSEPERDMRSWVISNAFVSVHKRGEGNEVKGGDDAKMAKWLRIEYPLIGNGAFTIPFYEDGRPLFTLRGKYREEGLGAGVVTSIDENPLAFDHGKIIATAFLHMISFDLRKLVFFFLPEKFTLSEYIGVYQYLTHYSIEPGNIPNFRRQLTEKKDPLLEVCEGEFADLDGRAHAPAKLYRRRS